MHIIYSNLRKSTYFVIKKLNLHYVIANIIKDLDYKADFNNTVF